ncbi:MAG: ATP phosphoribosyltransferase [Alphaproteobacteria bacterium]|nr:ATP phosphoribosyltransferase [Alphaproteobacteria bacterium]
MSLNRIQIALQKNGRLAEDSLELLKNCGLRVVRSRDDLFCRVKELPIDLLLVRDDDIPNFVSSGICDLGIVGENVFSEVGQTVEGFSAKIVERLGFSACRLVLAVPENGAIKSVSDLEGATIATSYPQLLHEFLKKNSVSARTLNMTGSVEVAPRLKIADAICDIVASGATLAANGLCELTTILKSEALLIRSGQALSVEKEAIIHRLLARIRGALGAEDSKYVMLHADKARLPDIIKLLPGAESPTILPLQGVADKVAVHAVCREAVFWETMEQLQAIGASSILVLPIEKMMG